MTDVPVKSVLPFQQVTATAGQTVFDFPFLVVETEDLAVYQNTTLLTSGTDYTISSGLNDPDGGQITLTSGATLDDVITMLSLIEVERLSDFPRRGSFKADVVNAELDNIYLILKELRRDIDRAIRLEPYDTTPIADLVLPEKSLRSDLALLFGSDGSVAVGSPLDPGTLTVSAYIETLLDDANAAAARATLNAMEDLLTTQGDIITGDASGDAQRIAIGTLSQILRRVGNDTAWGEIPVNEQTAASVADNADAILIYDATANAVRKMTRSNLIGALGKHFVVPVSQRNTTDVPYNAQVNSVWPVSNIGAASSCSFFFWVPSAPEFNSLTEAVIVMIPDTTEVIQYDVSVEIAAAGEAANTHTASITNGTISATAGEILEIDISSVLANMAADDYVGFKFESDTSDLRVTGLRIKHT